MALNVPGVAVMMFFYLLVLGIGIWASIKSKKEAKKGQGDKTEMALLGNRGINLVVGIFTMTGELTGDDADPSRSFIVFRKKKDPMPLSVSVKIFKSLSAPYQLSDIRSISPVES